MVTPVNDSEDVIKWSSIDIDQYNIMGSYGYGFAIGFAGLAPKYAFKLYGAGDMFEEVVAQGYTDGIEMYVNSDEYLPDLDMVEFDDDGEIIWDTDEKEIK
jgi:hypothetical protein